MEMVSIAVEELHLVGKHPFLDDTWVYVVKPDPGYYRKNENKEFILITPNSKFFRTKEEGMKELKTIFK